MHTGSKGQNLEIRDILYCFVVNLSSCGYVLLQQIPAQLTVIKLCNKVIPQVAALIQHHLSFPKSPRTILLQRSTRFGKDACKRDPESAAKVSHFFWFDFPRLVAN